LKEAADLLCALSLSLTPSFLFLSFTFGFVHLLQTDENAIFLVMEKTFHSGLNGTMILYTILACFVT
jgi:hypothetical protein